MPRQVTCVRARGQHLPPHEQVSYLGGTGWTASGVIADEETLGADPPRDHCS